MFYGGIYERKEKPHRVNWKELIVCFIVANNDSCAIELKGKLKQLNLFSFVYFFYPSFYRPCYKPYNYIMYTNYLELNIMLLYKKADVVNRYAKQLDLRYFFINF